MLKRKAYESDQFVAGSVASAVSSSSFFPYGTVIRFGCSNHPVSGRTYCADLTLDTSSARYHSFACTGVHRHGDDWGSVTIATGVGSDSGEEAGVGQHFTACPA
ncbi:MAG: hypothetical protein GY744_02550 [Gammaproteobacteria bacterium]|nr:hypothetical protein [Gammaproteobacteria bacterium]